MQIKSCTSSRHEGAREIPVNLFGADKNRKDGLHSHCKACRVKIRNDWYQRTRSDYLARANDRYYEHHEENKAKNRVNAKKYKEYRGVSWALLMSVKSRAKRRKLEIDLTEADIVVPERCPILGILLQQTVGPRGPDYPTVDRIDNTKGYTKDNILVISWRANNLKGTATLDELILLGEFAKQHKDTLK